MNKTLLAALAACVPFATSADPRYSYIEAGYVNIDGDLDGVGAATSATILPRLHVYGEFDRVSDSPLTREAGALALGLNHEMAPNTDVVARLGWAKRWVDIGGPTATDDGVLGQVGLRSMLTDTFELNGLVSHADIAGADPSLSIGGVFGFTPAVGVTGGLEFTEDDTIYRVGLRYSFP